MRNKLVCIFAHPDDEAFEPAGTIALYSKTHDVYLLCATKGESCGSKDTHIAQIREKELLDSANILGVKKVIFLGFKDGSLCNGIYYDIAAKVKAEIEKIKPEILLTFEPRGVSGHIDHITISMVTTYLFEHLSFVKTLLYYCHTEEHTKLEKKKMGDYFVYFPPGYAHNEIGKIVDITSVWDKKVSAIKSHKSQMKDGNFVLSVLTELPKKEYFLVLNK